MKIPEVRLELPVSFVLAEEEVVPVVRVRVQTAESDELDEELRELPGPGGLLGEGASDDVPFNARFFPGHGNALEQLPLPEEGDTGTLDFVHHPIQVKVPRMKVRRAHDVLKPGLVDAEPVADLPGSAKTNVDQETLGVV
jgi:hypothetical protein